MNYLADTRFLQAIALLALIPVVIILVVLRARRRRRAEQQPMRIRLTEEQPGEEP